MKYAYPKIIIDRGLNYGAFISGAVEDNLRALKEGELCSMEILDDSYKNGYIEWQKDSAVYMSNGQQFYPYKI